MCLFRAALACLVVSAAGAAAGRGADASRRLEVCIVDTARSNALDSQFQRDFAVRLGESVRVDGAAGFQVHAEPLSAREAAQRLKTGACAAVLVVGADRPGALRRLDAVTFAGTLDWRRNCTPLYLVVGSNDPLRAALAEGFRSAMKAEVQSPAKVASR